LQAARVQSKLPNLKKSIRLEQMLKEQLLTFIKMQKSAIYIYEPV